MARPWLTAMLTTVAVALCVPMSAQARTPCPGAQVAPTPDAGQVSDAIFCLSNQIRASYGLPAFARDARLDTASLSHSTDMGERRFFDHVNPDGLGPGDRAAAQGYTLGVGENIAAGYSTARAVVLGWMESAGHCRNMLSSARQVGVGTFVATRPYYTQMFGDYFSVPVDEAPRNSCPHKIDPDTLGDAPAPPDAPLVPTTPDGGSTHADPQAPAIGALSLSSRRLRARRGATTISYTLATPATVTFRVTREGRRGRLSAVAGRITDAGEAGVNRLRFDGRIGGRALRPGRYRLEAVAADAPARFAAAARVRFIVVAR
jgi:uncharacterized protein YkwD